MMDIQVGDEIHFKNGEVSRIIAINELHQGKGFYLDLLTQVHGYLDQNIVSSYWSYYSDGKIMKDNTALTGNDIMGVVHKGTDDFFHLYEGDVIITSNGSEAKIAEDVVLLRKKTTVHITDKININTKTYKARKADYITVDRDNLLITSFRGPNTRIIKIIRGDRNEKKDV